MTARSSRFPSSWFRDGQKVGHEAPSHADAQHTLRELVDSDLSVNSGVYAAVDPELSMRLNERGEYEYVGLEHTYSGPAADLLGVSAFGGKAPNENDIARSIFSNQKGIRHHSVAGYYVGAFAGWAREGNFRANGSSGGITTWLLTELLNAGEVDGVVHLRCGGTVGQLFSYQISRTPDELKQGSKSRYYPGELSDVLREVREVPGRYAVVGIPSFIYELRLLQKHNPLFAERIRYLFGLVCGHQKTANYATYLGWRAGITPGNLRSIDFRSKVEGQPANRYSTEFTGLVDGVEETWVVPQTELFGTDWGLGFFKSNFSDFTQDAFNETADVVFGDAWLPEYTPEWQGTNVVVTRNRSLHDLLVQAASEGRLHLEPLSVENLIQSQTALVRQSITELPYRFRYLAKRGEVIPLIRRTSREQLSRARRAVQRSRLRTSRTSHSAFLDALRLDDLEVFDARLQRPTRRYRLAQLPVRIRRRLGREIQRVAWVRAKRRNGPPSSAHG